VHASPPNHPNHTFCLFQATTAKECRRSQFPRRAFAGRGLSISTAIEALDGLNYCKLTTSSDETVQKIGRCFLNIPPEIRIVIYGLVWRHPALLYHPMTIPERQRYRHWWRNRSNELQGRPAYANELDTASRDLSILRVSKLISNEALPIFYSINKFRFPVFSHPVVPELPPHFLQCIRRVFLSFELLLNIPINEAASYITDMTRYMANSGAKLETFTLILWMRSDHYIEGAGEIEAREILREAMSSGFLELRQAMATASGTLSTVNGPSLYPGWLGRSLDRPVRREGMMWVNSTF